MLLRIFRSYSVYNFILIPIIGGLLLLKSFLHPGVFPPVTFINTSPFSNLLYQLNIPFWGAILINFVAVLVICFQLLYINAAFSFVRERTFLPAYLFLFIVYTLPELHVIQPVFFSGIFILLAINRILSSFEKRKAIGNAFDAGFLTGMAGLFYPGALLLVFLIPFSLYTLRNKVGWREFVTSMLGMILPVLYTFSYYFIINKGSFFFELYTNVFLKTEKNIFILLPVKIYCFFLIFITIISSAFIIRKYDEKKISTRRYFKILFFYFFTSLFMFFLPTVSYELLVILTIPLTFLITNYFIFMRSKFWAELFFTILILTAFALQFIIE